AVGGDVRPGLRVGPRLCVRRADPAIPAADGQRCVRIPGAGVSLLGRRPGRLHRPPAIAGPRVEGGGNGPPAVPPPCPAAAGMAAHDSRILPKTPSCQGARTMTGLFGRSARRIAPLLLTLGLVLSPAASRTARAQEEAPSGSESKGDPVPGYLGAGLLTMLVLFIVGKSARR